MGNFVHLKKTKSGLLLWPYCELLSHPAESVTQWNSSIDCNEAIPIQRWKSDRVNLKCLQRTLIAAQEGTEEREKKILPVSHAILSRCHCFEGRRNERFGARCRSSRNTGILRWISCRNRNTLHLLRDRRAPRTFERLEEDTGPPGDLCPSGEQPGVGRTAQISRGWQ